MLFINYTSEAAITLALHPRCTFAMPWIRPTAVIMRHTTETAPTTYPTRLRLFALPRSFLHRPHSHAVQPVHRLSIQLPVSPSAATYVCRSLFYTKTRGTGCWATAGGGRSSLTGSAISNVSLRSEGKISTKGEEKARRSESIQAKR